MLAVLVWVLAVSVGLLLLPVRMSFDAEPQQQPSFRLKLSWLFGWVQCELRAPDGAKRGASDALHPRSKMRGRRPRGWAALLRSAGVRARLRKLVRDLIASFRPEIQGMRIELGLSEPADTGRAWAVMGPISGWLMYRYPGRISLAPNFAERVIRIQGHAHLTVIPLLTLGILAGFLASPSVLRAVYAVYREQPR